MFKLSLVTGRLRSSAVGLRAATRWPWAGLLLAFALSLAGPGQIPSAQAAPANGYTKSIYMVVRQAGSKERTVCVGDMVDVRVSLFYVVDVVEAQAGGRQFGRLYGVPLAASVTDPGIGTISPPAMVTSKDADPAGEARFTFAAKKAGTTTVKVDATIINHQLWGVVLSSDKVSGELPLTVDKCEYRVNLYAQWHMPEDINLYAEITDAGLAPYAQGKWAGNADVKWSGMTSPNGNCYVVHHPQPSRAYMTGEIDPTSGNLHVNITFEATPALANTLKCPNHSFEVLADHLLTPEPLDLWFRTTGGSDRRHPALVGADPLSQLATVNLVPLSGS